MKKKWRDREGVRTGVVFSSKLIYFSVCNIYIIKVAFNHITILYSSIFAPTPLQSLLPLNQFSTFTFFFG